jgi:DnaJ-class molecular chaperone
MKLKEAAEILGCDVNTPIETLKARYRQLALAWHPDKCTKANAKEKFQQISIAYTKLISAHSVGGHRLDADGADGIQENSNSSSSAKRGGDDQTEMAAFMRMFMDLVGMFNESCEPIGIMEDGKISSAGAFYQL